LQSTPTNIARSELAFSNRTCRGGEGGLTRMHSGHLLISDSVLFLSSNSLERTCVIKTRFTNSACKRTSLCLFKWDSGTARLGWLRSWAIQSKAMTLPHRAMSFQWSMQPEAKKCRDLGGIAGGHVRFSAGNLHPAFICLHGSRHRGLAYLRSSEGSD
jgi:hypothetical protein